MSGTQASWRALADAVGASATGLDWRVALGQAGRVDPYMAWYDVQRWPGLRPRSAVTVLVQGKKARPPVLPDLGPLPLTHGHQFPLGSFVRSYRIALTDLHRLQALTVRGEVVRFEVEVARGAITEQQAPFARAAVAPPAHVMRSPPSLPPAPPETPAERRRLEEQERAARREQRRRDPLIGIVDDTLNFLHGRWRVGDDTPDQVAFSKLMLLWDQSEDEAEAATIAARTSVAPERFVAASPAPWPTASSTLPSDGLSGDWVRFTMPPATSRLPEPPHGGGPRFGRELREGALDAAAAGDDSAKGYQSYEYPRIRSLRPGEVTAGQAADAVAGEPARGAASGAAPGRSRSDWEMRTVPMRDWSHGVAVASVIDHEAGGLPAHSVMFASLPLRSTEDTSGGSLAGLALDAIVHFLSLAEDRPLVVNLSYGTHQGPHDGTSLFETALDELLRDHENLHVVLPVGNSHLLRTHQHALVRPGQCLEIPWKIHPDDPTDNFMEVWCHDPDAKWAVEVVPPGGLPASRAGRGQGWVLQAGEGRGRDLQAAIVFPTNPAQGLQGSMALVAVSPTLELDAARRRRGRKDMPPPLRRLAPDGVWTVRVINDESRILGVHAWVQRDDAAPGGTRAARGQVGRQSYIMDTRQSRADASSTINGIATLDPARYGGRLIVTGALRQHDGGLSSYSAAGPSLDVLRGGVLGPSMVVPGDESMNQPGLLVPGSFGRSKRRISGTSLAAAVVAGRLFRHLQAGGRAADFGGHAVDAPSDRPLVPEGAPAHAPIDFRGVHERFTFEPLGDRLDEPTKGLAR